MVNGINKPPKVIAEHAALGERLAESNRQLAAMQAEHRQLLLEMEQLRLRAGEISQRTAEQLQQRQSDRVQALQSHEAVEPTEVSPATADMAHNSPINVPPPCEETVTISTDTAILPATADVTQISPINVPPPSVTISTDTAASIAAEVHDLASVTRAATETLTTSVDTQKSQEISADTNDANTELAENDPEYAKYLQEKLAKIAALKTQFQRVQNLIETTKLIEMQMDKKNEQEQREMGQNERPQQNEQQQENVEKVKQARDIAIEEAATGNQSITINENGHISNLTDIGITASEDETAISPTTTSSTCSAIENEKEELLGAMMNMFTVFTADLRSQADHLRAERDRLRAIKAELLKRKGLSEN